jgi:hypothetical protein
MPKKSSALSDLMFASPARVDLSLARRSGEQAGGCGVVNFLRSALLLVGSESACDASALLLVVAELVSRLRGNGFGEGGGKTWNRVEEMLAPLEKTQTGCR